MSSVVDILKYSGPISLADLRDRISLPPAELTGELLRLSEAGLINIVGPLGNQVEQALAPEHMEEATQTLVELSGRGLRGLMAV